MKPEKLNIYDRIFNRYREEVIECGKETWSKRYNTTPENLYFGLKGKIPDSEYVRNFVIYRRIDRLTGSEKIRKEYLN